MIKLANHCWNSRNADLETDIRASHETGYKYIELVAMKIDNYLKHSSVGDLKALLDRYRIKPTTINSIEFIAFRGEEFTKIKDRCRQLCEWCKAIDCPIVILVPSPYPSHETTWEETKEEYVKCLKDLDDIARPEGIKLAFEFLGFGWSTVRTPRGAYEIVCETGSDNIGVILDCMHIYAGGGLLEELESIDPRRIFSFHLDDMEDVPKEAVTDQRRLIPGRGVIPLDKLCAKMAEIGFDGYCAVELFRPEYYDWDPVELSKQVRQGALKFLEPHFKVE